MSEMERLKVTPDVDFFNLLIKKRQMRQDHSGAQVRQRSYSLIFFTGLLGCLTPSSRMYYSVYNLKDYIPTL